MFIINCLPFSKGLNRELLSYFSTVPLEPGSLLRINVRGKNIPALVTENKDARNTKLEIKSADFQIKKISSVYAKPFLQKEFLEAVKIISEYFAVTQGSVLSYLIPSFLSKNPGVLSELREMEVKTKNDNRKIRSEITVLQAPDEERFAHYRSLVREEFAKKRSVFFCLPQNEDIRQAKEKLERGIEPFVFAFHKDLGKRQWKEAYSVPHPILLIGTAPWLFLPRNDFGTIIVDRENENGWKTLSRPFIDLRFFAEALANKKNIRFVMGDSFVRTETLYRYKQSGVSEFENIKWRLPSEVKTTITDLKKSGKKEKEFRVLSPEILELINKTVLGGSNMFIFAARKGLSSTTVCRDCGEQVKCYNCSSPMVLYKTKTGGVFKCHQCGETRDATEVCQNCRSWRLAAFGAGIDRVAEEIKKSIPKVNLFEVHKDVSPTSAKVSSIIKNFYESKSSILLGTEMAFSYLHKKVASSAIASFDSLFSIPDFRIREKIFRLILQTRNLARENFLIQTRNPDDPTVEFAVAGNLMEFYKKEIGDRRVLGYPPFGIFIKITARGTRNFVVKETENLKNILAEYNPAVFSSIHEKRGEQAAVNAVIRLLKERWIDRDLLSLLKSLSSHLEIKVDPDNLL